MEGLDEPPPPFSISEQKRAREFAEKWRSSPETFGDMKPDYIADSMARRLLKALDEIDRLNAELSAAG